MAHFQRRGNHGLPLFPVDMGALRDERTRALTGDDATVDEAAYGDAGNGADFWASDLAGAQPIEDSGEGEDIQPDEVRRFGREREEAVDDDDELRLTARPSVPLPLDPYDYP